MDSHLVVELLEVVVVVVVEVHPPCVVVRVDRRAQQDGRRHVQTAPPQQSQLVPGCLIKQDQTHNSAKPHHQGGGVHVEVNMLVANCLSLV